MKPANFPVDVAQTIATPDDRILWGVVANAGRISNKLLPRWVHVMEATSLGSTKSAKLCRRFGFDPDVEVNQRKRS